MNNRYRALDESKTKMVIKSKSHFVKVWTMLPLWSYLEESWFTDREDYEALKCPLAVSYGSSKMARWSLRRSGAEFVVVNLTGIKHQAANPLWNLPTAGTDKTKLDDEALVLNISPKTVKSAYFVKTKQEEEEPENYCTSKEIFPFSPSIFAPADKTE